MGSNRSTREARTAAGKCAVCLKRKATPGNKTCRQCRAKMAAYDAKRRAERLAAKAGSAAPPPASAPKPRSPAKITRATSASPSPAVTPADSPRVVVPIPQAAPVSPAPTTRRETAAAPTREFWESWAEEKPARAAKPRVDVVAKPPAPAPARAVARPAPPAPPTPAPPTASRDPLAIAQDVMAQLGRRDAVLPSDDELLRMARELNELRKRAPERQQLYVSDRAAKQFADHVGISEPEAARRQLAGLLRNAHPTDKSPGLWRARQGRDGPDISVRVAPDDSGTGLLVVVGIVNVRNVRGAS